MNKEAQIEKNNNIKNSFTNPLSLSPEKDSLKVTGLNKH